MYSLYYYYYFTIFKKVLISVSRGPLYDIIQGLFSFFPSLVGPYDFVGHTTGLLFFKFFFPKYCFNMQLSSFVRINEFCYKIS